MPAATARKPHARALRMERANVQLASRCGNEPPTRAHNCATFVTRCTMMRSNRPSAAAAVCKSH
eukprot:4984209-Lingulodinium_polyedra.AAC.1